MLIVKVYKILLLSLNMLMFQLNIYGIRLLGGVHAKIRNSVQGDMTPVFQVAIQLFVYSMHIIAAVLSQIEINCGLP